jgi:NADH-quinone oxidoreductase subunit F
MLTRSEFLTKVYPVEEGWTFAAYERAQTALFGAASGGYRAARKAAAMSQADIVAEAKKANIRGRGGAGFPMGVKWGFMRPSAAKPAYLVVNADEGEPGTHKDRTIMERNPHAVIEGCIIACYGIGAHVAYIYVRDELHLSKTRLEGAIAEARALGHLGKAPFGRDYPVDVFVHTGAGAYICGEETALLNSLEGRRGEPRLKPPFPAQAGAFGCPTTVNNLETIALVPTAFNLGCAQFSELSALHKLGDGGVRLYGVNGHVKKPGVYELHVGVTLRELIYDLGGGVLDDRGLLGVIPGGSSTPVLRGDEVIHAPDEASPMHQWHGQSVLDVPMGVDTMRAAGSMVGTCCATVMAVGTCPVLAMENLMAFYHHESCGQCTPCREGSAWIHRIVSKILDGRATMDELDSLHEIANNVMGNTICAFGDGMAMPALGFLKKFRRDFEAYVRGERKRADARLVVG